MEKIANGLIEFLSVEAVLILARVLHDFCSSNGIEFLRTVDGDTKKRNCIR